VWPVRRRLPRRRHHPGARETHFPLSSCEWAMSRSRDWATSHSLERLTRPSWMTWCIPVGPSVRAPHRRQTGIRPFVSGAWSSSSCPATCIYSDEVIGPPSCPPGAARSRKESPGLLMGVPLQPTPRTPPWSSPVASTRGRLIKTVRPRGAAGSRPQQDPAVVVEAPVRPSGSCVPAKWRSRSVTSARSARRPLRPSPPYV
jgi:hypothetical protein